VLYWGYDRGAGPNKENGVGNKLSFLVGLTDGENVTTTVIESSLLLETLRETLAVDRSVFNQMTATEIGVVAPEAYEEACRELGIIQGLIQNAINSKNKLM
jgi:hypothetical protein